LERGVEHVRTIHHQDRHSSGPYGYIPIFSCPTANYGHLSKWHVTYFCWIRGNVVWCDHWPLYPCFGFSFWHNEVPSHDSFYHGRNALYVLVFSGMRNKPVGMVLGSVVKFLWLSASVYTCFRCWCESSSCFGRDVHVPQLATAVMGGVLALLVLGLLKKSLVE